MTLQELHNHLFPAFPKISVRKDLHTAVRVLAQALGCADPQHCHPEHYTQPLPTLYRLVEDYLRTHGKSAHTTRNTKNNLSRLFRLASQQHLFALAPAPLTPRHPATPRIPRPRQGEGRAKWLPYAEWPLDAQKAFGAFQTWATAPVVPGRPAHLRKRATTLVGYRRSLEAYFGYLSYQRQLLPTFDHLFDVALVSAYVHWHVNDCHQRSTRMIKYFLSQLMALTKQYRPLPALRTQLLTLTKTLPTPADTYNKTDAWVSLATLREIAKSLWPQKQLTDLLRPDRQHPGLIYAHNAALALMLHLWTYIPYRSRNMREMLLDDNLYQDDDDHWRIRFQGAQLKIAVKHGQANVFDLPFPPTLVPLLTDYLRTWHPILLRKVGGHDRPLFPSTAGKIYTAHDLRDLLHSIVYRYTEKHWHPHIIRTVWATEHIRKTGDFYGAAIMLNDRLDTVIAKYTHLRDENVAENIYRLLDERNGQGT